MSADDFTSTEAVRYKRWKVLTINRVFGNIFLVVFMARNTWSTTPSWPRTRIQFTSTWTLIRLGATVFLIFNRRCWDLHTSSYFPGGGLCRKGKLCEYERAHPINLLVQEAAGFFYFPSFLPKVVQTDTAMEECACSDWLLSNGSSHRPRNLTASWNPNWWKR